MQPRFSVLMAVSDEPGDQMDHKIDRTAMTSMLDLRDIFELVDNGLNNRPFAHQEFIRKVHEVVLHVFTQPGNELESLFKEQLRERSRDVATIPEQLAVQLFDQARNWSAIIGVAWRQATRQQFASVIDRQMQFETKEPAHARLPAPGVRRKDAVPTDALGIAHFQRGRVDEADACAGSVSAPQIGQQGDHHLWDQCHKARLAHLPRKFAGEVNLNVFRIVRFERPIRRLVKMDENRHDLAWPHLSCSLTLFTCC